MRDNINLIFPRIGAYVIDIIIVTILCNLISNIRFLNPSYDEFAATSEKYSDVYKDYIDGDIKIEEFNDKAESLTLKLYRYGTSNYVISLITLISYFGIFQKYNNGQTIGKKLMKIRVVGIDDGNVPIYMMILRILPMYIFGFNGMFCIIACIIFPHILASNVEIVISSISIINILLGFIDIEFALARKDKRSLHDLLSKTKVIEVK